ncbi:MAG TPA: glycosyltransferase family 4 protein [Gemmatimonadales bacterium]|nr:glycosyltransferase family 4 protein [Gemmatimonadales bacterium]
MKVGLVVIGGVARAPEHGHIPCLHWLIERLARRSDVHVFSLYGAPHPDRYPLHGATVHHIGGRPTRTRGLAAVLREHWRGPFDVFHAFWANPPGVIAAMAGALLARPVLLHLAGNELVALPDIHYGGALTRRGRFWTRLALRRASTITAASEPMLASLRTLGFTGSRVPLGVDLSRWPTREPRRRSDRAARLVHVGSLNGVKDQEVLLEAARQLTARGVDFRLDIVGADTVNGRLEHLADALGLGGRVQFHGYLPHPRLYPIVGDADLLWMSSRHEAGPVAVLEAAVLGVPTVGTSVGHIAEWAPDAAVAVPIGDAAALAVETEGLLRDDARRLTLAREAQRRALACDADWTAARFAQLYDALIATAPRARVNRAA